MRYGICVPNLGEFVDPRQVAGLAPRAEDARWDGFFVWDHVVFPYGGVHEVAEQRGSTGPFDVVITGRAAATSPLAPTESSGIERASATSCSDGPKLIRP